MSTPTMQSDVQAGPAVTEDAAPRVSDLLIYLLMGVFFGIILIKSEVVSWFRIQEMFRFQAFHMYGIIGSAIVVAALSVQLIKRADIRTIRGEPISIKEKSYETGKSQILGGIVFGLGWGLLGACPGPIYALIGAGFTPVLVGLVSAIAGAWAYGQLQPRLPH